MISSMSNCSVLFSLSLHILTSAAVFKELSSENCLKSTQVVSTPPSPCHPNTRQALRDRIATWLADAQREEHVLWATGPVGSGKSAVAQTIMDYCFHIGRAAVPIFLSKRTERPERSSKWKIAFTLARKLAVHDPEYKKFLLNLYRSSQHILARLSSRSLFQRLIVEPLETCAGLDYKKPLVIILDGLEEYVEKDTDHGIIDLIIDHVHNAAPILWVITSRSARLPNRLATRIPVRREELLPTDAEAVQDVSTVLRDGFRRIYERYSYSPHDEDWPTEAQLQQLSQSASGLFICVSCIVRFVRNSDSDPKTGLETCLVRINDVSYRPRQVHPFSPLDVIYQKILIDINFNTLPLAMRILELLCSDRELSIVDLMGSLRLDADALYNVLYQLDSVLYIPSSQSATIGIHPSFVDFIRYRINPLRRGLSLLEIKRTPLRIEEVPSNLCMCIYFWLSSQRPQPFPIALAILAPIVMSGAELDSPIRHPLPRCPPKACKVLKEAVLTWLNDSRGRQPIFWITGLAGVGKSAFAQTMAEHCHHTGQLGTALFFSRDIPGCDDPRRIIPTLAYHLAVQNRSYKSLIASSLMAHPRVLEKDLYTQFHMLIKNPFMNMQRGELCDEENPLVIILDGLDACGDGDIQRKLAELFSDRDLKGLLCIFCSRAEESEGQTTESACSSGSSRSLASTRTRYSRSPSPITSFEQSVIYHELTADDAYTMDCLRDSFCDIRRRFSRLFGSDEEWPTRVELEGIARGVSGYLLLASYMLRFITDEAFRDPKGRLKTCLKFVNDLSTAGVDDPLRKIDLFYQYILLNIQPHPIAMRILELCAFNSGRPLAAQDIMEALRIDRGTLDSALHGIQSLLYVPPPEGADIEGLRFYHHSFVEFLKDTRHVGGFIFQNERLRQQMKPLPPIAVMDAAEVEVAQPDDATTIPKTPDSAHHERELPPGNVEPTAVPLPPTPSPPLIFVDDAEAKAESAQTPEPTIIAQNPDQTQHGEGLLPRSVGQVDVLLQPVTPTSSHSSIHTANSLTVPTLSGSDTVTRAPNQLTSSHFPNKNLEVRSEPCCPECD